MKMKVRTLRKRAQRMIDTAAYWSAPECPTKMYKTRDIKPCKKPYTPYCSDCNAVLFRKEMGRFPHTIAEFNAYEQAKQDAQP